VKALLNLHQPTVDHFDNGSLKAAVLSTINPDPPNDLAWSFLGGFVIFVVARAVSGREVFAGLSGFSTRVVSGCAVWGGG